MIKDKLMKKILFTFTLSILSTGAWADCSDPKTTIEVQKCLNLEVGQLKHELNNVLKAASESTNAQKELKAAQTKWLAYKESQCGDFVVADSQGSPATIVVDLACQTDLYKERIGFLKNYFSQ